MEPKERTVLTIEIRCAGHIWLRSLCTDFVPNLKELEFYYIRICGFLDATVSLNTQQVPHDFKEALLTVCEEQPTIFPTVDLDTVDESRMTEYRTYITQLCDMERTRARLTVIRPGREKEAPQVKEVGGAMLKRRRKWVTDLLAQLNAEVEEEYDMVPVTEDHSVPYAWVFTPTVHEIRRDKGSRVILDLAVGKAWEQRLGSDLYPDFVVSRRVSSASWAFQHPSSIALVKAAVEWYLASQDAKLRDGVSDWIPRSEVDLALVFAPFKKMKLNERMLYESLPTTPEGAVGTMIQQIETGMLESQAANSGVFPLSYKALERLVHYTARSFKIPPEAYKGVSSVHQVLLRWVRSQMGVKPDSMPILTSWHETWSRCIRGCATAERVGLFLNTLDSWDTYESTLMSEQTKQGILEEWIKVYADHELVAEPHGKIQVGLLDGLIKEYCNKYIPHTVFNKLYNRIMMRKIVGDVLLKYGFRTTTVGVGKSMIGVRLKHPPDAVAVGLPEAVPLPPMPTPTEVAGSAAVKVKVTEPKTQNTVPVSNVVHLGKV